MRILEFLLSNIYWVIVIVGFLLTMRQRSKAGRKPGRTRTSRMPTFGGGPDDREPGTWLPGRRARDEERTAAAERPAAEQPRAMSVGSAGPAAYVREPLVAAPAERGSLAAAAKSEPAPAAREQADAARLEADADAVRRGVVWAEILGPPRARKPYSYRK
ncbi:hypothetical protein [Paenibacillus sp. HJGM_3]|uniref:hypothetical protein n=1 Tax=Paenibacillus sp. HJGM_3 TaxID=3379816 RepID=UPI0038583AD6